MKKFKFASRDVGRKFKVILTVTLGLSFSSSADGQNIKPFASGEVSLSRKSVQSMSKDTSYTSCSILYYNDDTRINTLMTDDRIYDKKGSVIVINKEVYVIDDSKSEYMKMKYNTLTGDADKFFIDPNLFNQQFIENSKPYVYDSVVGNTTCRVYECTQKGDSLQITLDKKMYSPHKLIQKAYVNVTTLQMVKYEQIFKSELFSTYETLELISTKPILKETLKANINAKVDSVVKSYSLKSGEVNSFTQEPKKVDYSYLTPELVKKLEFKICNSGAIKFNEIEKKNILIVFWYSSCIPCILKIPDLNELAQKYKSNLEIIAVNFVEQDIPYINDIISKNKIRYKVAIDDGRYLKEKFKIYYVPSWFLFNQNAELIETNQNLKSEDFKTLIGDLIK